MATAKRKRAARRPPKGRGAANVHLALRNEILHLALKPGAKLDKHLKRACIEHDQIVRSIEKGAAAAERLAREHTNTFRQRLKDFLSDGLPSEVRLGRQIR